jgi:hypothetical protein
MRLESGNLWQRNTNTSKWINKVIILYNRAGAQSAFATIGRARVVPALDVN